MIDSDFMIVVPALFGLLLAAGVWLCFWWQRVGWTVTLTANVLLISYGMWTGQYGFSIAVPLAAAAQVHHLYRTRREPFTGRRVPAARTHPARTRRRLFRHETPLKYLPGRAPAPLATPAVELLDPPYVALKPTHCPCGFDAVDTGKLVTHIEVNRGNPTHWMAVNRNG
jgi:hypothetical protein